MRKARDEAQEWKSREQSALLKIAAELLLAGFKGDGVVEGVEWLASKIAHLTEEREGLRAQLASLNEWTPTAERVNALPDGLRSYVHQLETNIVDPAGDMAALVRAAAIC